jgi:hypothetical protein
VGAVSKTAEWVYTNIATVRPFLGENGMTGEIDYGAAYQIACTWTAESKQTTGNGGEEFVSTYTIYTQDARPRYLDRIFIDDAGAVEQTILSRTSFDMSFFSETNDFKLVT